MTRQEFTKRAREEAVSFIESLGGSKISVVSAYIRTGYEQGASFGWDQGVAAEREYLLNLIRHEVGKDARDIIRAKLAEREGGAIDGS